MDEKTWTERSEINFCDELCAGAREVAEAMPAERVRLERKLTGPKYIKRIFKDERLKIRKSAKTKTP